MFIAKFQQVSENSEKFNPNKNGEMPFIGEVNAGPYYGALIDGTIFKNEGYEVGVNYACSNRLRDYVNPETGEVTKKADTIIIQKLEKFDEIVQAHKSLGAAVKLDLGTPVKAEDDGGRVVEPEPELN